MAQTIPNVNKIHVEDHETHTNIPTWMLSKVLPWLDKAGVKYTLYTNDNIPEDFIQGWHFRGFQSVDNTAVIVSNLNSKELHSVIENELYYIDESEI